MLLCFGCSLLGSVSAVIAGWHATDIASLVAHNVPTLHSLEAMRHNNSLLLGLGVLLLFGIVLAVIWWQQMQKELLARRTAWSTQQLDSLGRAFLQQMQGLLSTALERGPEIAVAVCADTAQRFTELFARQHGILVRRTALRWRNPRNQPDSTEAWWIAQFERWNAEGRSLDTVIVLESSTEERLLRPILIRTPQCLLCHGTPENIPPEVATALAERYPEDRARNFRLGDVRGALSIRAPR